METFGQRLEHAITLAKSSRKAVAHATGRSEQSVGQVIRGDTVAMSAENCARAAELLKVDFYWLATGEGSPEPRTTAFTPDLQARLAQCSPEEIRRLENMLRAALDMGPVGPKG